MSDHYSTGGTLPKGLTVAKNETAEPEQVSARCPWKIHWGTGQEYTTQCSKPEHVFNLEVEQVPDGRISVRYDGDPYHEGPTGVMAGQTVTWMAGGRREYTGDWPGLCTGKVPGCVLHAGHHGRCAP